jgi:ribonuclease HI
MDSVVIYTDGSCQGNPGPGGWAAILSAKDREKIVSGHEKYTTNNRMELMAAVEALRILKRTCDIKLYTDSTYLKQGMSIWINNWRKNGWRGADKKPIKNQDLWLALDEMASRHRVEWHWVKAHCGHEHNERVDRLAKAALEKGLRETS